MDGSHHSRASRLGSSSVGTSIAIVVALVAAVGLAVTLRGNRTSAPRESSGAPEGRAETPPPSTVPEGSPSAPEPPVGLPKLVDLGAGKCIPCKMMAPILEALKKDFRDKLEVVFIDVWEKPEEAKKYEIQLIPTQIFYDASGKERFRHEGFLSREDILAKWKELGVDVAPRPPADTKEGSILKGERSSTSPR